MTKPTFRNEWTPLGILQSAVIVFAIIGGYYTIRSQHDITRIQLAQHNEKIVMFAKVIENLAESVRRDYVQDRVYQAERAGILLELSKLNIAQKETTEAINALRVELAKVRQSGRNE